MRGAKNFFFMNKTQRTLEALKTLALRVLFMQEKNKQNEEMNKTVLFINRLKDGGRGGRSFVHFEMRYLLRGAGVGLGRMPHYRLNGVKI